MPVGCRLDGVTRIYGIIVQIVDQQPATERLPKFRCSADVIDVVMGEDQGGDDRCIEACLLDIPKYPTDSPIAAAVEHN